MTTEIGGVIRTLKKLEITRPIPSDVIGHYLADIRTAFLENTLSNSVTIPLVQGDNGTAIKQFLEEKFPGCSVSVSGRNLKFDISGSTESPTE